MKAEVKDIIVKTSKRIELIDITKEVEDFVSRCGVQNGQATITTRHTTTAIIVNENEEGLIADIEMFLASLVPKGKGYLHDNISPPEPKNADSHLKAMLLGASETLPIINWKLSLGTYQKIIFVELDGPRERVFTISIIGD